MELNFCGSTLLIKTGFDRGRWHSISAQMSVKSSEGCPDDECD